MKMMNYMIVRIFYRKERGGLCNANVETHGVRLYKGEKTINGGKPKIRKRVGDNYLILKVIMKQFNVKTVKSQQDLIFACKRSGNVFNLQTISMSECDRHCDCTYPCDWKTNTKSSKLA